MKILCETQLFNRQTQSNKSKTPKATIAIGFHNSKDNKSNLEIIHFTPQNRNGVRYKVTNNIENIFTRFLQDGKATISFKEPPENLMMKCEPIQLKSFLQTLKLGLQGKSSMNLRLVAAATAIPTKQHPVEKMIVNKRSDYPTKGFPRTLKTLTLSGLGLHKITFEVCSLMNLTTLKLSNNKIHTIPNQLGRLPLIELDLANNNLGEEKTWCWLAGNKLKTTLREVDMSNNQLRHFPAELVKLENLVTLKLNHNNIKKLPFGIRGMQNLRFLHLSNNKLESLPSSIDEVRLDLLDVWENNFQPICEKSIQVRSSSTKCPPPLWLSAAQAVSRLKLPLSTKILPWILVDLICESPKCFCGGLCFGEPVWERAIEATLDNIKELSFSRDRLIYADIVVCSASCASKRAIF